MSYSNFESDPNFFGLLSKYEQMAQEGTAAFFSEEQYILIIDYFEQEFQMSRALEAADHALTHYSYSAAFYIKKAEMLLKNRHENEAMETLLIAESFAPHELQIHLIKSEILSVRGQSDEALAILDELKDNYTSDLDISEIFLSEAFIYDSLGMIERTFYALKSSLMLNPNNTEALQQLWICVELTKKYTESIELHERILDVDAYSYLAWYNLGHAHAYLCHYDEAINAYEYAYITNPNFQLAYRDCAEMCFELKRYRKALKCYQEVLEIFPPDCDLFLRIGQCYQYLGNPTIARTFFQKAIEEDAMNDEVYFHIGETFANQEQWRSALPHYKQAIQIDDRREDYLAAIAEAYYQLENYKQAENYFLQATITAPELSQYWLQYASFLMEIGKGEEALEILMEAEENSSGTELLYCRIACLFAINRRQEALYWLGEALCEDYSMHDALFDLAPFLENDREVQMAISAYSV